MHVKHVQGTFGHAESFGVDGGTRPPRVRELWPPKVPWGNTKTWKKKFLIRCICMHVKHLQGNFRHADHFGVAGGSRPPQVREIWPMIDPWGNTKKAKSWKKRFLSEVHACPLSMNLRASGASPSGLRPQASGIKLRFFNKNVEI